MKTLLTTTAVLSVGFIFGANQPIQAAAPTAEGIFATKERSSLHFAAVRSERKPQDTREFERSPRDDIERFERDQMRLQQLEHTEQTDFERVERDRERAIEREKRAAQQAESPNTTAPAPAPNNSVTPPDYDPAKIKQQAAEQGRELSPEEVQQIQDATNAQGNGGGVTPSSPSPTAISSNPTDYDPEFAKQQQMEQQAQ